MRIKKKKQQKTNKQKKTSKRYHEKKILLVFADHKSSDHLHPHIMFSLSHPLTKTEYCNIYWWPEMVLVRLFGCTYWSGHYCLYLMWWPIYHAATCINKLWGLVFSKLPCWINCDAMPASNCQPVVLLAPGCWYKFTYLMTNNADPDQLASEEANSSVCTLSRVKYLIMKKKLLCCSHNFSLQYSQCFMIFCVQVNALCI